MEEKKAAKVLAVGNTVAIRTATYLDVGTITAVDEFGITLHPACWVADTARFESFCKTGETNEHEPFAHPVVVAKGGIIDVTLWPFAVPTTAK
jgi:hypothetical protein